MQLVKDFFIRKVCREVNWSGLLSLILEDQNQMPSKAGKLVFDAESLSRHRIAPSLNLVGQIITCTLTTHELPRRYDDQPAFKETFWFKREDLGHDDMLISQIKRTEEKNHVLFNAGWREDYVTPKQHRHFLMTLYSYREEYDMECVLPYYDLTISLSEQEYNECWQFPRGTVFRATFSIHAPPSQSDPAP